VSLPGRAPLLALLIAGLWLASPAGTEDSFAQTISAPTATTVRDNIATTIESIRLSRGVPDGTVLCRGNRAAARATLRCDIRYVEPVSVTGVEISERNNPANVWSANARPYTQAEDETAYLILIDRSNAARAQSIQRATRDLAEIFRQLGPINGLPLPPSIPSSIFFRILRTIVPRSRRRLSAYAPARRPRSFTGYRSKPCNGWVSFRRRAKCSSSRPTANSKIPRFAIIRSRRRPTG
jgi:hypothetical protein